MARAAPAAAGGRARGQLQDLGSSEDAQLRSAKFVRGVIGSVNGRSTAWVSPENLPVLDELDNPAAGWRAEAASAGR
jgi:uncharacterized protein (DUF2342 family)